MKKYCIIGGAGFIGSHLVRTLLSEEPDAHIVIYDNFSSGRMWHLEGRENDKRVKIVTADVKDKDELTKSMEGSDIVYHFAANPDIAKAVTQPDIDFWEGTYLTNNVLEAMRKTGIKKLLYASGSGVYGDAGLTETAEDYGPMVPISTYGASKLSCEALMSSYCHMFDMTISAFRFANVVGPHQTHGVGYDFVRKLALKANGIRTEGFSESSGEIKPNLRETCSKSKDNPQELTILGNGTQSKSYIYVDDVVSAIRILEKKAAPGFSYYNVATLDYITVNEIADITKEIMGITDVEYKYTGGNRGWKGDVPIVRLNSQKIRNLGWTNKYTSREAIYNSISSIFEDAKLNKFGWKK